MPWAHQRPIEAWVTVVLAILVFGMSTFYVKRFIPRPEVGGFDAHAPKGRVLALLDLDDERDQMSLLGMKIALDMERSRELMAISALDIDDVLANDLRPLKRVTELAGTCRPPSDRQLVIGPVTTTTTVRLLRALANHAEVGPAIDRGCDRAGESRLGLVFILGNVTVTRGAAIDACAEGGPERHIERCAETYDAAFRFPSPDNKAQARAIAAELPEEPRILVLQQVQEEGTASVYASDLVTSLGGVLAESPSSGAGGCEGYDAAGDAAKDLPKSWCRVVTFEGSSPGYDKLQRLGKTRPNAILVVSDGRHPKRTMSRLRSVFERELVLVPDTWYRDELGGRNYGELRLIALNSIVDLRGSTEEIAAERSRRELENRLRIRGQRFRRSYIGRLSFGFNLYKSAASVLDQDPVFRVISANAQTYSRADLGSMDRPWWSPEGPPLHFKKDDL